LGELLQGRVVVFVIQMRVGREAQKFADALSGVGEGARERRKAESARQRARPPTVRAFRVSAPERQPGRLPDAIDHVPIQRSLVPDAEKVFVLPNGEDRSTNIVAVLKLEARAV
jgi:hypothetical protein